MNNTLKVIFSNLDTDIHKKYLWVCIYSQVSIHTYDFKRVIHLAKSINERLVGTLLNARYLINCI